MITRNITTLSLITAAIIGLNGCGGDSSSPKTSDESLSSIAKLSNASQKHSQSDWIELQNHIEDLDDTEGFNTMLLGSIEKNVGSLTNVGIDKEEAYAINSDIMYDDLVELQIPELDNEVVGECQENEICKEEAYASLQVDLTIDKEEAYAMAVEVRDNDKEEAYAIVVNDGLVKEFSCAENEVKTVQHYGFEDAFSTANGAEPSTPAPHIALVPWIANYPFPITGYDEVSANRIFAETVKNLPANVVKGNFYIGFKSNGTALQGNDTMTFGNYANGNVESIPLNTLNWTTTAAGGTTIFSNSFNNIDVNGSTLLDMVQNNQQFDVVVQDDTSVDFITVATCSPKDPIKEIETVVNKFECSEKETMMKILGGKIDAFALAEDTTTPSSTLVASNTYPKMKYDNPAYDKHFIDTLDLGLTASQTVTKAQFHIGYKSTNRSLWTNDALYLGNLDGNRTGFRLYNNNDNIFIENQWGIHTVNGETIASTDLNLTNTVGTGTVLDTMKTNGFLDVYLQDDTTVDFTQLNLCVKDNCDESAKDYKIDLSQLNSWTNRPSDAQENASNNPSVWAADMNWIKFDNNGTDRILEIPFCACGNTIANIEHLKGDNRAKVELGSFMVEQLGNTGGTTAFSTDSAGGNHVDGTTTIAGTGVGVNHTLRLSVHNFKSSAGSDTPFGVAIAGILTFKGNLGKCTK